MLASSDRLIKELAAAVRFFPDEISSMKVATPQKQVPSQLKQQANTFDINRFMGNILSAAKSFVE